MTDSDATAPSPHAPAVVALSPAMVPLALKLRAALPYSRLHAPAGKIPEADIAFDDAAAHLAALFQARTPIIGVCPASVLIRAVAPHIPQNNHDEAPLIAVAEAGPIFLPLLGGHRGAHRLAKQLQDAVGGTIAVTSLGHNHPPRRHLAVGVGFCSSGTAEALIALIDQALRDADQAPETVGVIASLDGKLSSPVLQAVAAHYKATPQGFSKEALAAESGRITVASDHAATAVGVPSVAEAAALAAVGADGGLVSPKRSGAGVTCAVAAAVDFFRKPGRQA